MKKGKKADEPIQKGSPKLKNGFTWIPHELLEAIIRTHFSANESKILWKIMRETYGWHRKEAEIPLLKFKDATGILKPNLIRTLKQLNKRNMIIINNDNGRIPSYRIQKNYLKWRHIINIDNERGKSKPSSDGQKKLSKPITSIINTDKKPLSILIRKIINIDKKKLNKCNDIKGIKHAKYTLKIDKDNLNIDKAKTISLSLREFLLKTKKESLPNYKSIESFARIWDKFFQKKYKKSYSFSFEENLGSIKEFLKKNSVKGLQEMIERYFRISKDLEDLDFTIKDFSLCTSQKLEQLEGKAKKSKTLERDEKRSRVEDEEDEEEEDLEEGEEKEEEFDEEKEETPKEHLTLDQMLKMVKGKR